MNTDFRLSTGLTTHPKTIKLMRRCGDRAFFCLINLWGWAAQYKPDGDLSGMDDEAIEIAADWMGDVGAFVAQLVAVGFVDGGPGVYRLHDWCDHNPWACVAEVRSERGRLNKLAVKYPEQVKELKKSGVIGVTREEYKGFEAKWSQGTPQVNPKQTLSEPLTPAPAPAPAPAPSPTPSPTPIVIKDLPPTACARADDQFLMNPDWTPSEYFPTLANTAGVVPPTGDELEAALREFVPFWMTQKRRCTTHEWDLAFIKALKGGFASPKERSRSRPQALSPRQQYMQDIGNLLEEIDGITTEGCPTRLGEAVESLPGIRPQLEHAGKAGV